jgi:hypothetical protein
VVVNVKEKQTGTFQLSAGYSSRDGLLGLLSFKKDNLFGHSQSVSAIYSQPPCPEFHYFNPDRRTAIIQPGTSIYWRKYYNYFATFLEERQVCLSPASHVRPDPVTAQWRSAAGRFERPAQRHQPHRSVDIRTGLTA